MKLLLKACSTEYWDCSHVLVDIDPKQVAELHADRDLCVAFLANIHGGLPSSRVTLPACRFDVQFGNPNIERLQDCEATDLDDQEWAIVGDDFEFTQDEYERTDCTGIQFWRDGDIYITGLAHWHNGSTEALFWPAARQAVLSQPEPVNA